MYSGSTIASVSGNPPRKRGRWHREHANDGADVLDRICRGGIDTHPPIASTPARVSRADVAIHQHAETRARHAARKLDHCPTGQRSRTLGRMGPGVDTSEQVTDILSASQLSDIWTIAIVATVGVVVLALAQLYRAAGGPTLPRAIAWYQWRKAGKPKTMTLEEQVEKTVTEVVLNHTNAMTGDILTVINERADAQDKRLSALVLDVAAVRARQSTLSDRIVEVHETANEAKQTQARVVNSLDRVTGTHRM